MVGGDYIARNLTALAMDGRRVEALRACTRVRTVLREVGIELGEDLADLERRVLDGDDVDAR